MKFWRSSVAVLIVLIGIAGVLRNNFTSIDRMYDNFYETPSWSPERSLSEDVSILQKANISYIESDWNGVLEILNEVPESNSDNPVFSFYKAASLQNLNDFKGAIEAYTKVIDNGDNMFVEEAEWYRGLCYLKLENYEKAKQELFAVLERKGHYEPQAKAVIRRLKYSIK